MLQIPEIRHAMNFAIDKDSIVKVIFRGYAVPIKSPLAPGIDGAVDAGAYAYDQQKAKSLLESIGCVLGSDGIYNYKGERLSFRMNLPNGLFPNDQAVGETLQSQLKAIGIEVKINKIESASYWASLRVSKDKVGYDMAMFGYNPSHGDPTLHLEALFSSNKSDQALDLWNFIWYKDTKVDELLVKAKASVDQSSGTSISIKSRGPLGALPYIWSMHRTT
jgi:ABC-type transport system substrate-binding protein